MKNYYFNFEFLFYNIILLSMLNIIYLLNKFSFNSNIFFLLRKRLHYFNLNIDLKLINNH